MLPYIWVSKDILSCIQTDTPLLLLMLALQPTMCLSLLGDFLPFRPFLAQFSPPSYSHCLDIFLIVFNPSFPWSTSDFLPIGFHSNILLGILCPSIRVTYPSQAILLLFKNLICMHFLWVHSVHGSFWFSKFHFHLVLGQKFFLIFSAQICLIVVHFDLLMSRSSNISQIIIYQSSHLSTLHNVI